MLQRDERQQDERYLVAEALAMAVVRPVTMIHRSDVLSAATNFTWKNFLSPKLACGY
jgi:hypothetical protein